MLKSKKIITVLLTLFLIVFIILGMTGCGQATEDKKVSELETEDNVTSELVTDDTITSEPEAEDKAINEPEPKDNIANEPVSVDKVVDELQTAKDVIEATDSDQVRSDDKVYFGDWVINQVIFYGVGTYSAENAESLYGKVLSFTKDSATHFSDTISDIEKVSSSPVYFETVLSEYDFVTNYNIAFIDLGIESTTITVVQITDAEGFVCDFLVKDENTLILFGGGTYFELIRKLD